MKVVFLYTELAEYFIKCCEKLAESCEVHIVHWPINKEAPFQFSFSEKLKVYPKANYTFSQLSELVARISPDVIVCSGWVDKDYLIITRPYYRRIPTLMSCDTHWKGTIKQYAAVVLSRIFLLRIFSHAWVPGKNQVTYVKKLGFKTEKIKEGFYCCDLPKFNAIYNKRTSSGERPKRFLYVGRYYQFKGITDLWDAFIQAQNESNNEWELWCLGTGDIEPAKHKQIKHFGFVQPKDLDPFIDQCSVFVLPSRYEPWGVVVQEYAAAGLPLVLSTAVGAAESFLEEGGNGYGFIPGNVNSLKAALKKTMNLSSKELNSMSEQSHFLAQRHSPFKWANTVLEIYHEAQKK